jgi:cell shape-determining protein MreC
MKNIIQTLKSYSFFDYLLFLLVFSGLILSYSAFREGDIGRGFDKLTIAILFANMFLAGRIQGQSQSLIEDYQTLSDLKSEIIDDQEKEIESLRQENAKLKDKQVYPAGFEG